MKSANTLQSVEFIWNMFSDLVEIKLEINKDNKNPKRPNAPMFEN